MSTRAILIVDHGSRRPEAHEHLKWIASLVQQHLPEQRVYVAHMELAEPSIQDAIDACVRDGAQEIVVHPLFLVPGRHLEDDIPHLVEAAATRYSGVVVRITPALGSVPDIAGLILQTLDR